MLPEREKVERLQRELEAAQSHLASVEKRCEHDWTIVNKPIYDEGYTCPGDPPGTMGVDWRGPSYVSPETTPRWIRTCKKCGKVEHTCTSKKETKGATLDDGTRTTAEVVVPDWSHPSAGPGREGYKRNRY